MSSKKHNKFRVNLNTGSSSSDDSQPIETPPSHYCFRVPVKPFSTNPADYKLPAAATTLPRKWNFAITPKARIYYYHLEHRIPQWEPPTHEQMYETASDTESESDSTDDNDEVINLKSMKPSQVHDFVEQKAEKRRQRRYKVLVEERSISPRREEDRIYNQMQLRKYKENKEKISKRKEERRSAEALKKSNVSSLHQETDKRHAKTDTDEYVLPIQDYLLSSDEEDITADFNNMSLLDKILQEDKIVDELDASTKTPLKRSLTPYHELI